MVSKTFMYVEAVLINLLKTWIEKLGIDCHCDWLNNQELDYVLEKSKNEMSII
jgi:hypothetical protein